MKEGNTAYTTYSVRGGKFGIACCVRGEEGFHPVPEYGPYSADRAEGVADRLNRRLGVEPEEVAKIVASTMVASRKKAARG